MSQNSLLKPLSLKVKYDTFLLADIIIVFFVFIPVYYWLLYMNQIYLLRRITMRLTQGLIWADF